MTRSNIHAYVVLKEGVWKAAKISSDAEGTYVTKSGKKSKCLKKARQVASSKADSGDGAILVVQRGGGTIEGSHVYLPRDGGLRATPKIDQVGGDHLPQRYRLLVTVTMDTDQYGPRNLTFTAGRYVTRSAAEEARREFSNTV